MKACALFAVLVMAGPGAARAQDDGPRGYMLAPTEITSFGVQGIVLESNQTFASGVVIKGLDITGRIGVAQFAKPLNLAGVMVAPLVIVPFGEIEANFAATRFNLDREARALVREDRTVTGRSAGLGDIELGAVVGLYGAPPLTTTEYVQYDPGLSIGALVRVALPSGEYNSDKAINFGANRWAVLLGLPMTYYRGKSFLDPALTTFELVPGVLIFTDNYDPFGAGKTEQKPIFTAEAHITQNLGRTVWVSLDARYRNGGETITDGVAGDDRQEALGLGGTLGLNLTSHFSLKATYGEIVWRNDNGPDGRMFRLILGLTF
jgi:hypothetical protein